jgi:hypothetical protein
MEEYVEALNRRMLQAEAQTSRNGVMMEKVIHLLQSRLVQLEASDIDKIAKQSQDEAVRLALLLASQPAPPMPDFAIETEYNDFQKVEGFFDDVTGSVWGELGNVEYAFRDDHNEGSLMQEFAPITDAEATTMCTDWKRTYNVVTGVSWGDLPYDLQQKWLHYSCDYHLAEEVEEVNR